MKTLTLIALFVASVANLNAAPGPEYQKLAALVGNWRTSGESIASPLGPAEKFRGTVKSEWFPGRFAVIRHVEGTASISGKALAMHVITWDRRAKVYTWYLVDDHGTTNLAKASISGDTITVDWWSVARYQIRGVMKGLGADKLTWVEAYSEDGKTWNDFYHSADTRTK